MRGLRKFHHQCVVLLKLRSTSQFYKGTWKPVAAEFQRASTSHFRMEPRDQMWDSTPGSSAVVCTEHSASLKCPSTSECHCHHLQRKSRVEVLNRARSLDTALLSPCLWESLCSGRISAGTAQWWPCPTSPRGPRCSTLQGGLLEKKHSRSVLSSPRLP